MQLLTDAVRNVSLRQSRSSRSVPIRWPTSFMWDIRDRTLRWPTLSIPPTPQSEQYQQKAEGRADCVAQEQGSVQGRAVPKAKAFDLCFLHSFIFSLILFCIKARVSFVTQSSKIRRGCVPVEGGCVPKWDVKISPACMFNEPFWRTQCLECCLLRQFPYLLLLILINDIIFCQRVRSPLCLGRLMYKRY